MTPEIGIAAALALGLIFGSFANVCIHRLPDRRSVVWPGSACPACGAAIAWYDNIPVLSWLALGGRCRRCRAPISWRYPLVEALAALITVRLVLIHGLTLRWAGLSFLGLSLLVLVPIDWKHGILPDAVTLPGLAAGLLLGFVTPEPGRVDSMLGAAVGGLVPFTIRGLYMIWAAMRARPAAPPPAGPDGDGPPQVAPLPAKGTTGDGAPEEEPYAEERREGMGLGDVKMLAMVGAFLGVSKVLLTMLLGSVIGTIYVVPLVLSGRHDMKTPVPFGPFLAVAAFISMFWGRDIIDWYTGAAFGLAPAG